MTKHKSKKKPVVTTMEYEGHVIHRNSLGYFRFATFTIEEIRPLIKDCYLEHENHYKRLELVKNKHGHAKPTSRIQYKNHTFKVHGLRLENFYRNGTKCQHCGIKGAFYSLDSATPRDKPHINLIGIDNNGNEVLMTADHIIPKALGGADVLENLQTLCHSCNNKKGCKTEEELMYREGGA